MKQVLNKAMKCCCVAVREIFNHSIISICHSKEQLPLLPGKAFRLELSAFLDLESSTPRLVRKFLLLSSLDTSLSKRGYGFNSHHPISLMGSAGLPSRMGEIGNPLRYSKIVPDMRATLELRDTTYCTGQSDKKRDNCQILFTYY